MARATDCTLVITRIRQTTSLIVTTAIVAALVFSTLVPAANAAAPATTSTTSTTASKDGATATVTKSTTTTKTSSGKAKKAAASAFESEKLSPEVSGSASKSGAAKKKSGSSGMSAGLRALFGLLIVVGVIYGVHWMLKRFNDNKRGVLARGASEAIEVLATTPLTPTRTLHLVKVGPEILLIGATDAGLTKLSDVDASALATSAAVAGDSEFHQALNGAITGTPTAITSMSQPDATPDTFMKRFVANLQMMTAR